MKQKNALAMLGQFIRPMDFSWNKYKAACWLNYLWNKKEIDAKILSYYEGDNNANCSEALKKADLLINGSRARTHGDATETHTYIAQIWNILLRKKLKEPLDIHDVYRAMIGIKQIRNSQKSMDN